MMASVLREAGYKVGLYTSPHLVRFNERIRVNGVPIDDESIVEFLDQTQIAIETIQATFFEATSAMAFWYFQKMDVDWALIETGLGGRLDSTNVLTPKLSVITSIGLDHKDILGETLSAIAREKGGIIKPKVPVVLGPQKPHVQKILADIAHQNKSPVYLTDLRFCGKKVIHRNGSEFTWENQSWSVGMIGYHQIENACVALTSLEVLFPGLTKTTLAEGLNKTHWPGRLEQVSQSAPVFYDVAHNAHGLGRVLEALGKLYSQKPIGFLALKGDKDLGDLVKVIRGKFHELWVSGSTELGLNSAAETSRILEQCRLEHKRKDQISGGLIAFRNYQTGERPKLIFGSHYFAKQVYSVYDKCFDKGII